MARYTVAYSHSCNEPGPQLDVWLPLVAEKHTAVHKMNLRAALWSLTTVVMFSLYTQMHAG